MDARHNVVEGAYGTVTDYVVPQYADVPVRPSQNNTHCRAEKYAIELGPFRVIFTTGALQMICRIL